MTSAQPAAIAVARQQFRSPSFLARLVRPSLTDVLFIGILMWTVVLSGGGWHRLLWDGDTGLHIRIGNFILQNGYVPTTDPLSFTRAGHHWLATEWLTGVLFAFLSAQIGLKAVVFLSGVTIAATLMVVLRTSLLAGANGLIALAGVLMTMNASSFHYHARPHVFTWLFLAIALQLLMRDAMRPSNRIWLLVPMAAIWANLHGGYAILFAVLGITVIGAALRGTAGRPALKRYALVTLACGAASLLNPFGYKLHLETLSYLRNKSVLNTIQEFQAPTFRTEPQIYFMILLFAALAVSGFVLAKRRYADALLIFCFGYLGLTSVRHIPLFLIVAVPILTAELSGYWNRWAALQPRNSLGGILKDIGGSLREKLPGHSVWSAATLVALWTLPAASSWPRDFSNDRFPVEIARRHSAELATTRLFTTDQWADYLMFRNPAQRDFLDDRVLFDQAIIADALKIMDTEEGWRDALARYDIDAVLCPPSAPLGSALLHESRWKLVDKDNGHVLFRRELK